MVHLFLTISLYRFILSRSAACTANIIAKLNLPLVQSSSQVKAGFPLVCTNGARGLRVIHKSYSDDRDKSIHVAPHRSNTTINNEGSDSNPSINPFLNETLIIDEELFHTPLPEELVMKTLALAHRLDCVTNYYQNHHIYAVVRNEGHLKYTQRYANLTGSTDLYRYLNPSDKYEENESLYTRDNYFGYQEAVNCGPPSKLLIVCSTDKVDEITHLVNRELNGDKANGTVANVIRGSPPFFVEILHPEVHKGHGLKQLCEEIGVPLEEVVAFGDGDNDIEFLQLAGRGVAMKNARETLKAVADEITEWTNDEVRH
jgi:hydroxymethylpyrimidine pyrophosphatase-like HAD family hydrolase